MSLRLGLPSKGRLMEKTLKWFAARGIEITRTGGDREYAAEAQGADLSIQLMSAGEVPRELEAGRLHLGVTGSDLVRDRIAEWDQAVEPLEELGFGFADLLIAVPNFWVDVEFLDDLDAAAADFRAIRTVIGSVLLRSITVLCAIFCRIQAWPTINSSTAKARPKARSGTTRPRPLQTFPQPAKRCAPITSNLYVTV